MVQVDAYWKDQFAEYLRDPITDFERVLRHTRAAQIRKLLADPNQVDLQTFTREVWRFGPDFRFGRIQFRSYSDFSSLSPDELATMRDAIVSEQLVLHGNYMWSQPTSTFDATNQNDAVKLANLRKAFQTLNNPSLTPRDKAHEIVGVRGFGVSNATALVWLFHPYEYAVCNLRSVYTVNMVTHAGLHERKIPESDMDPFQALAQELKDQLGAPDFLVLDCFFDWVFCTKRFPPLPEIEIQASDDEKEAYPEGVEKYVTHLSRERNPGLVAAAKHRFLERYRRLYCQACGFDFAATYGARGDGYIPHFAASVIDFVEIRAMRSQ